MTTTVAVTNHKGGVGKTTVAVHLSCALAELGHRVLIVDLDSSAGATRHFGLPINLAGAAEVLVGERAAGDVIHSFKTEPLLPAGVDLLAGSVALSTLEQRLARRQAEAVDQYTHPWEAMREPMRELRGAGIWDWIVLDTGPGRPIGTTVAYLVADLVLAVVCPESPSLDALSQALAQVEAVRKRADLNPELCFLGAVLSRVDHRQRLDREYRGLFDRFLAERGYPAGMLATELPVAQAFKNAWHAGRPLFAHREEHRRASAREALEAVRRLAREVIWRAGLEGDDAATGFDLSAVRETIGRIAARGGQDHAAGAATAVEQQQPRPNGNAVAPR